MIVIFFFLNKKVRNRVLELLPCLRNKLFLKKSLILFFWLYLQLLPLLDFRVPEKICKHHQIILKKSRYKEIKEAEKKSTPLLENYYRTRRPFFSWQGLHRLASGRARRRSSFISFPQSTQIP